MADCERVSMCSFFDNSMGEMPGTAEMYKSSYCRDKHDTCARNALLRFLEEKKYDISDRLEKEIDRIAPRLLPNDMAAVVRLRSL